MLKLILSNISEVPLYEQIKNQIKDAILSGELEENFKLVSIRSLAKELNISVLTINRAYKDLENEGYINNIQGKGCFVIGKHSKLIREHMIKDIEENLLKSIKIANKADISKEDMHSILDMMFNIFKDEKLA